MPTYLKKIDKVDEPETTIEELEEVSLDKNDLKKKILVGTLLTKEETDEMIRFLRMKKDVFTWSYRHIPGIDPSVT